MGPKVPGESLWKLKIEGAVINDEVFNAKVMFIDCAGSEEDLNYLTRFENFASGEKRYVIKNICNSETIFMINQLGTSDKKTKDENHRVFEEGQLFLKQQGEIPADILALIIKELILKKKEEYLFIKQHRLDVQEGLQRESLTMIEKQEVRGIVSQSKSALAPAKDKTPLPEPVTGKKYNTVLRERGEEWRDRVYVDDFPLDGPNIYIAVTGFKNPHLPVSLIQIGVPISAIVQIRIDATTTYVPPSLHRMTKRNLVQNEVQAEKSLKYWQDLQDLRISKESTEYFKNTAFIIFKPPYWDLDQLTGHPDKIYDEISYLLYDIHDLMRQHAHFLDEMEVISIPDDRIDECYGHHYSPLISGLPLESVTIFSIMDSILNVVCKQHLNEPSVTSFTTKSSVESKQKNKDKSNKAKTLIKDVFSALCKTEEKFYRVTYGEEFENHKNPIVIKYGDFVKYPTFHLNNMNLDNIVAQGLLCMPLHKLWLLQNPPKDENEAKLSFHVNMLLTCFEREDVETAELTRLIHILACRKIYNNRSSLKQFHISATSLKEFKKVFLKRSVLAEPFRRKSLQSSYCSLSPANFPSMTNSEKLNSRPDLTEDQNKSTDSFHVDWLFHCPDISELVSAAEIANNQPINHMIDDFEFFEDFHGTCAPQILMDAFSKFNCVDYKYCEVTDSIILMFFNSHDKDGISREEWRCSLPTSLCLQDFFDFVLEEHYDWFIKEEKKYDQDILASQKTMGQKSNTDLYAVSCIDDINIQMDLILEGSLKHQEMLDMVEQESSTDIDTESTKKTSTIPTPHSGPKNVSAKQFKKSSIKGVKLGSLEIKEKKHFLGYDIGDRRVEVFGKDSAYFSKDRTRVSTFYTLLVPQNVEYIVLNVVPGDGTNEFWIHRALGEFISPQVLQRCEGFRVNTKDNLMINFKKKSYQVPVSIISLKEPSKQQVKETPNKKNRQSKDTVPENTPEPQRETKYYYDFCITWPNGLIIEGVYENDSDKLSHIKQYALVPFDNIKEDSRCISMNGDVIIFKTSGNIEVLRPDGTYINITKCEKTIILPEVPIVKKVEKKVKPKGKEKKDKSMEIPLEEIKPPEFELIISEFDIIEPDGLQQNWIDDMPYDMKKLLIRTATDYITGEVLIRRADGTNTLINKDGLQIVTFPDKTRIVTTCVEADEEIFPEWTEEELILLHQLDMLEKSMLKEKSKGSASPKSASGSTTTNTTFQDVEIEEEIIEEKEVLRSEAYVFIYLIYTVENSHFPTVTINKNNDKVTIRSPNNTSLKVDSNNHYELKLDANDKTIATFDAENLHITYEACHECQSYTTCDIKIDKKTLSNNDHTSEPSEDIVTTPWVKLKDSFYKQIEINEEGNIYMLDEPPTFDDSVIPNATEQSHVDNTVTEESKVDWKSESSITSHGKCREMYQAKNMKFIIMHRDLTCSELVHRALVNDYKKTCRWQPWCSMNEYDTFGDNRLMHTILTPVNMTETEKWLMESFLSDKPINLTFKDLKKNTKGWYYWMRPYERFQPKFITPDPVVVHKLPKAFVLRTLEQQWREKEREQLKGGKELLKAILRYRQLVESESENMLHIPIADFRGEDERETFAAIQAVAHRIYQELKDRIEDNIKLGNRAELDITTKPATEQMSIEGEVEEKVVDLEKLLYSERDEEINQVDEAVKGSALQKYWRIRAEALNEEEFYLYLLREGSVPDYFLNILGGALWWEINNLTEEAVTIGQRRKMKCTCEDGEGPSNSTP